MSDEKVTKIQAGFRCDSDVYDDVKDIADRENRSISEVLAAMVAAQVQRYKQGGWLALNSVGEE